MENTNENEILWKDRKRILGMPISFTKYSLSKDRIFINTGLFNLNEEEILLYRVLDVSLKLSFWQRIFRVGSIIVKSSDQSTPVLEIKNVKKPKEVKELVYKYSEEMKMARRIRVGEIIDVGDEELGLE